MSNTVIPIEEFAAPRKVSPRLYVTIYEGILCSRRATPHDEYREYSSYRHPGRTVYIREYDHIYGYLTEIKTVDKETLEGLKYRVFQFVFDNGAGVELVLEVPVKSDFVARFAKCCPNIDFRRPLFIKSFPDRSTHLPVIIIQQDGEKIEQAFTREKPNGLPQWERDPVTGEWDTRAYWRFLFEQIHAKLPEIQRCRETLAALRESGDDATAEHEAAAAPAAEAEASLAITDDDDIPF